MREFIFDDFPYYIINDSANNEKCVWSTKTNQWLTPMVADEKGHLAVALYDRDEKRHKKYIHWLIASAFLEKPSDDCTVVHHINHTPSDNRLENLQWYTRSEHQRLHMKGKFGKDHPRSKAVVQLTKDGEFVRKWDSMHDIERQMGMGHISANISACCRGKQKTAYNYKWVFESEFSKATIKQPSQIMIPFDEAI